MVGTYSAFKDTVEKGLLSRLRQKERDIEAVVKQASHVQDDAFPGNSEKIFSALLEKGILKYSKEDPEIIELLQECFNGTFGFIRGETLDFITNHGIDYFVDQIAELAEKLEKCHSFYGNEYMRSLKLMQQPQSEKAKEAYEKLQSRYAA